MGVEHLHALKCLPDTEIVAICDPHQPSLRAARTALREATNGSHDTHSSVHHEPLEFGSVHELVAYGAFDVAVVATPNHTHRRVLEPLLHHGGHVMIEKPLCITTKECREVIALEAATRHGAVDQRVVWVGLEYRYMPPTMRLLQLVRDDALGRLRMMAIREHRFPFLTKVDDWNRFNANTGGTLVEKCCHFFDLMRLVLASNPERIFASGAQDVNHLDELYDGRRPDIIDNAMVIVDFADGARASLDLCMFAEATKNEQEISVVGDLGKAEALVTQGLVRFGRRADGWFQTKEEQVVVDDVPAEAQRHGSHHGSSWREHVAMQRAIRNATTAEVDLHDGLWSVAMGEAAHRSINEGRAIWMDEVLGEATSGATNATDD